VRLDAAHPLHLTYCTNIHPAEGWDAVFANLRRYAPDLKRRIAPDIPFGLGLRLSGREAAELVADPARLDALAAFLGDEGLYVAIINGFPYGPFHGTPVKAKVYAPDWRDDARLRYTLDLLTILARVLPEGVDGGISTIPLSYKAWMTTAGPADWDRIVAHLVDMAAALARLRDRTGQLVHLDIEPEPDCVLETSGETIAFFRDRLLPHGLPALARALSIGHDDAEERLREHIQLCFDCCHFAVEYEDPEEALDRLTAAGLRIGRVQLSSALTVTLPAHASGRQALLERLRPFADETYLHQVIEQSADGRRQFPDLPPAMRDASSGPGDTPRDWRIHFHVPLFTDRYGDLGSSQDYVRRVLALARERAFTQHLEIETYTWDVLPAGLKRELGDSIRREYEWVLGSLKFEV